MVSNLRVLLILNYLLLAAVAWCVTLASLHRSGRARSHGASTLVLSGSSSFVVGLDG